jgi:TniQ
MPLLARTPAPFPDEGLFAYVLRLSQANAYRSPRYIAYAADIARSHWREPYPNYPAMNLEAIIGGHGDILRRISYSISVGNSIRFKLLTHELGRSTNGLLRLRSPAFCIDCVKEEGYIRAFWDMSAAVACPRHARLTIDTCPTCKEPLHWYRPELLRCACNGDLSTSSRVEADPVVIDLMKALEAKLECRPLVGCKITTPLPLTLMDTMPLASILRVIDVFGGAAKNVGGQAHNSSVMDVSHVLGGAELLLEWPRRFESWLECTASRFGSGAAPGPIRRIFDALFRRRNLFGMQRMKEDFLTLCGRHWNSVLGERVRASQATRSSSRLLRLSNPARIASAELGIPVETLRILRERGLYGLSPGRRHRDHSEEVRGFKDRMFALAVGSPKDGQGRKLKELLRRKFRNHGVKADLIEAVIRGVLPVVGVDGDKVSDLLLGADASDGWLDKALSRTREDTYTIRRAAAELDLDPAVIPAAITARLLEMVTIDGRSQITTASVAQFRDRYVPLVAISGPLKTSAGALLRCGQENGLTIVVLTRVSSGKKQSVILRAELPKLESLFRAKQKREQTKKRTPAAVLEVRMANALAQYIGSLRQRKQTLPRFGGKPNKVAIARACGFERNVLYRPGLALLLDEAQKMEQAKSGTRYIEPIERLRTYLTDLHRSRRQIPRWGGRPKLIAIATACGIGRDLFYKDREALRLVTDFV